ncbi:MAG: hypothetical protein AAF438_23210 [Pseudomonadota bacterium]
MSLTHATSTIGMQVPPYPGSPKTAHWRCLKGGQMVSSDCQLAIAVLVSYVPWDDKAPQIPLGILALKRVPGVPVGEKHWLVTDQIEYPEIPEDYQLAIVDCRIGNTPEDSVLAVVKKSTRNGCPQRAGPLSRTPPQVCSPISTVRG